MQSVQANYLAEAACRRVQQPPISVAETPKSMHHPPPMLLPAPVTLLPVSLVIALDHIQTHDCAPTIQGGYNLLGGQQQGAYSAQQPQATGYGAPGAQQPASDYGQQGSGAQQQAYVRAAAPSPANADGAAPNQQTKLAAIIAQVCTVSQKRVESHKLALRSAERREAAAARAQVDTQSGGIISRRRPV